MADIVGPDGRRFNKDGVRPLVMPFLGAITLTFLLEARKEEEVRLALQRGVTMNVGLSTALMDAQVGAQIAPPDVVEAFNARKQG